VSAGVALHSGVEQRLILQDTTELLETRRTSVSLADVHDGDILIGVLALTAGEGMP